jgi:predicted nucleic acid-binding Zn ribbon protein
VRRRVGNEAAMYIGIGALILIIVILLILLR